MPRHTFRKQEVLRGTTRIRALMAGGRSVNVAPFRLTAMYMELPTPYPAQVAFAVPRRVLRHAVDRNRVKRLMREALAPNKGTVVWAGCGRRSANAPCSSCTAVMPA